MKKTSTRKRVLSRFAAIAAMAGLNLAPLDTFGAVSVVSQGLQSVVFDSQSNYYWYRDIGDFSNPVGVTSVGDVDDRISGLNSSSYFGIANWQLAPSFELERLWRNATLGVFSTLFSATGSTAGQTLVGYVPPVCIPGNSALGIDEICVGGRPGTAYGYVRTDWEGLVADAATIYKEVSDPDNHPFCGRAFFPVCKTTIQEIPAHRIAEIAILDYEDDSPLADRFLWGSSVTPDSGMGYFDDPAVRSPRGAWVFGSRDSPVAEVPEPSIAFLAGGALAGLLATRRRSRDNTHTWRLKNTRTVARFDYACAWEATEQ